MEAHISSAVVETTTRCACCRCYPFVMSYLNAWNAETHTDTYGVTQRNTEVHLYEQTIIGAPLWESKKITKQK